ncbi:serine/threonine protein kinase (plasmid) [Nostoc sp. NIES-2111]|nr:serine/threonine protein kinase [Nostoc sp. NIES-2111]
MSVYCINPLCEQRKNPDNAEVCLACGTPLIINNRIRLLKPLRELSFDPQNYFEVFEVEDRWTQEYPVHQRRVMKVLKWNSSKYRELIEQEFLTLQLIKYPNIPKCNINDFFTFTPHNSPLELRCLLMDKIEGENLDDWIKSHDKITQNLAWEWTKQLVEILDVIHHNEFFHRDVKPANIILQPNGQLALVDFGTARRITDTYLAKISASGGTETTIGNYEITTVISPLYSPLEQINGRAVPQSDFYALGRTIVRLVTGVSLLQLPTDQKTGKLIWRNKAPQIDKPFADFLDELMSPLPGKRPQSTKIILERLENLPWYSQVHRIISSQIFKISIVSIFLLVSLASYIFSQPVIAESFLNQGKKALEQNQLDEAQNKFQQAVKIKPDLAKQVSNFYLEQGIRRDISPQRARQYYELSIKYNPQNDSAYNNLALICQQLQDIECVNNSYEEVFKLKPNKWESHYGLGSFYDDLGKYDLAEQQYNLAIKSSDLALDAVSNLARIKVIQGQYKAAINIANKGLQKAEEPELKAALYKTIGWAKYEEKKYVEAEKNLEKAQSLDLQRVDTYCLLAKTQEALGKFESARVWWEPCLLINTSLPEVVQWRVEILQRIQLPRNYETKK